MRTGPGIVQKQFNLAALGVQLFFGVLLFFASAAPLPAAEIDSGFEQANKLYYEGKYAEAVGAYEKLLDHGAASEALYFNRGNALFKMGQIGRAIASWRLAGRLAPRDPDLRANLQFARTEVRGGSPYRMDLWSRYIGALTLNEWTLLAAAAAWVFFALLAIAQWRPEQARRLKLGLVASGAAMLVFGVSLAGALNANYFTVSAIVTVGEAEVRNGPLDESQAVYKVRDGVELIVLDRKDNWLQVVDSTLRMGWVRKDQVLVLDPASVRKTKT